MQINNTTGQGFGLRDLAWWNNSHLLTSDNAQIRRVDTTSLTETATQLTGPGALQRGLALESANRIWKSDFTASPILLFDTTNTQIKTLGVPTVAPYGLAFDTWTSPGRGHLWMSEPSLTGTSRLSRVDTTTGALTQTFVYTPIVPTGTVGGLDIANDHPGYPGSVVAFLLIQAFPNSRVIVVYLGLDSTAVGVGEDEQQVPQSFALQQNYPNPFNPTTTIKYSVPVQSDVTLKIYSVLGQEVATVFEGQRSPGHFEAVWNGRSTSGTAVGTGVYFYKLEARAGGSGEAFTTIRKMLLLK
jgi:hypothetical protein